MNSTISILHYYVLRFICVVFVRLCYRVKTFGAANVQTKEGILLVCNHASWVDALLLMACQRRRIRFVIYREIYNTKWLKPLLKLIGAIPLSAGDGPKKIAASLKEARKAIDDGFAVCIFAEGVLTRDGMLGEFKSGFEHIMKGSSYEIVPVYIGGAWGSVFSYYEGKLLSTLPKKFPYPVSIHFGKAMPAESTASLIRQKVLELSCDFFNSLKSSDRSLGGNFVKVARKNWSRHCISEGTGRRLDYGKTLVSSIALGIEINKFTKSQEKIGIVLPPSAGGAIANLAVTLLGKVPVNLNYTASIEAIMAAIKQCEMKCIISSRKFVEKIDGLDSLPGVVFIEDILEKIKFQTKFKAYLKGRFLPYNLFIKALCKNADDAATIIFSSGSTGKPKGIVLSHHNIFSNIESVRTVIHIKTGDNLCGVLPFFHALGFTCGLWLPLVSGISSVFIANPLDGKLVGESVRKNKSTILFAPPTFLANYIRRAKRDDFSSLRQVFAGAEKVTKRLAESFEEHFGICLFEGYGATELSPVVSLNISDVEIGQVYQVGNKVGTVGRPIPGVAVKIVDVETKETLETGQEGLIMVKGANVMGGYLNMEKETAEVLKNGWYNTCDIGHLDSEGFVTITGRLSRFSKIAGEMVPHVGVEEEYLRGLGTDEQVVAVTGVPDAKKGEELVVLYLEQAGDADKLHKIISKSKVPNIWKPKRDNYIKIESIPTLGSGKLDFIKLHEIALAAKKTED